MVVLENKLIGGVVWHKHLYTFGLFIIYLHDNLTDISLAGSYAIR